MEKGDQKGVQPSGQDSIVQPQKDDTQHVAQLEFHGNDEDNIEKPGAGQTHVVSEFAGLTRSACMRKFWRLYLAGLLVSVGGMFVGYGNTVIGSIVANRGFVQAFATVLEPATGNMVLDARHISLWNSISFASQIVAQMISPFTADRFGRKFNMWLLTVFLTLSIVFEIVAKEYILLAISRVCSGLAAGMLATSVMVYMSEIAMPQFRGAFLGSFSLFMSLGQLFLAIGLKVLDVTTPMAFRNIFYSEFVFLGLWLIPMFLLPESPAWYAAKGKHDLGKKALGRLVGNVEGYNLEHEYLVMRTEIEESVSASNKLSENNWKALFTRINFKRTIIATLPFTFQNFVGVPLIFGNTVYFFSLAKLDDPFLGKLIIQILQLVGIITGFYLVDKLGRRPLVLGSGVILGSVTFIVGGLGFTEMTTASGIGLVTLCAVWAFVYANTLAPIGWISLVEISTPALRAKSAAVAAIIQTISGVIFSTTTPLLLSDQGAGWGRKIGLYFGGITFLFLIPCVLLYPETKGRTYQELDELFERRVPAWRFAQTTTSHQAKVEARRA